MRYTINAIETRYGGVRFRSRLEAKWAAMFDLLKWKWSYEPRDFDGWIPDFAIYGSAVVYVEVKPVVEMPVGVVEKIDRCGLQGDAMIVGERGPFPWPAGKTSDSTVSVIGWLRDGQDWSHAILGRWSDAAGEIGFCHDHQSFRDRISGGYDGGCFGSLGTVEESESQSLWREACNRVQWRPRR